EIAAMAAAMNGLDALVFTGGVGEHSSGVPAAAAAGVWVPRGAARPDPEHGPPPPDHHPVGSAPPGPPGTPPGEGPRGQAGPQRRRGGLVAASPNWRLTRQNLDPDRLHGMAALPERTGDDRITREQAALLRVAKLVARAAPPTEVFAAVTEEAGRLLSADY